VDFAFTNKSLDTENMLKNQKFRLGALTGEEIEERYFREPASFHFDEDERRLHMHFCIPVKVGENDEINFEYGLRKLKVLVPPVKWMPFNSKEQQRWYGEYPATIHFLNEPDPDWIIPLETYSSSGQKGETYIVLRAFNPSNEQLRDVNLSLVASDGRMGECHSTPNIFNTTLRVSLKSQNKRLQSSDFILGDMVDRSAKIKKGPCGERDISIDLGTLPAVDAQKDLYVRVLLDPSLQVSESDRKDASKMRSFGFELGGHAYPRYIRSSAMISKELEEIAKELEESIRGHIFHLP
jgi:hypothetical protein